jgi:coproporphyrinogen III oxidase-like Fe-S oxidoreductase
MELRPEHISCYGLKLEEGTPMYQYKDSPFLPDDDEQADMYLYAVELLSHYGYAQYEVSNFSIRGYESKHNLKYWRLEDYMGFGAGAHSYIDSLRYSFVKDAERYIAGVSGQADIVDEHDEISALERASEYIMMSMRTVRGLSAGSTTGFTGAISLQSGSCWTTSSKTAGPFGKRTLGILPHRVFAFKCSDRRAPGSAVRQPRGG